MQGGRPGYGLHEIDYALFKTFELNDNLSLTFGGWVWDFPSKALGTQDYLFSAGISHTGTFDTSLDYFHIFGHQETENGNELVGRISKTFPLGEIEDVEFSATPRASLAWLDNFYGASGMSQGSVGLSLGAKRKNSSLELSVYNQRGFAPEIEKNHVWFSLNLMHKCN